MSGLLILTIAASVDAAVYPGNGNTGFGGPIGQGSLTLNDDGTTISGTFSKGPNGFNDVLVLYLDTGANSGILGTANLTDSGDGLRKAISGFDGGANRSTLAFPASFQGGYAIALGPSSDHFGGLWQIVEGGSHNFISSVNLSPTVNNAATYTFSFLVTDIGLTSSSGATFKFIGTYISNSGYRSAEAVGCDATGTQGWNPFTTTTNATYTIRTAATTPPQITDVSPANGAVYVVPVPQVSFTVNSLASGVRTTNITLTLNGTLRTNLSFSGNANSWAVTDTGGAQGGLAVNTIYTGVITATDIDNNSSTNTFTFNTWSPANPFIEAEDYNFVNGGFINNFVSPSPTNHGLYQGPTGQGKFGSNGVDYLEYDLSGAGNAWRMNDLPQVETATDVDHNFFAANGFQEYNLAFIENGEWQNYTRRMSNTTYAVYARMAGLGNNASMLMERLADATATSSNQPRASLGTFVCPNTGGAQNWTFVQLKDFFSNPVLVRFSGTNTFRSTCLGADGSYNLNYFIFVPSTNTSTLRPYISAGYPFPGAGNVPPDQTISFTLANRQTTLTPGTQLFVNGSNVTSGLSISNNAAGSFVSYQPPSLLPSGTNNLRAIFSDGTLTQTNDWIFTVANLPVLPSGDAVVIGSGASSGFAIHIFKAPNDAQASLFTSVAKAEQELAGAIIDPNTSQPYPNEAGGPNGDGRFIEPASINYDITGAATGAATFANKGPFPYIAAGAVNNFIAMEALAYVQLSPGIYRFAVRSDDGFKAMVGPTVCDTNFVIGIFDGGRGNDNPSTFDFIVQTAGLYPMRLLYFQGEFGGNVEFYSINRANGAATLINDPDNPAAIKTFPALKAILTNVSHTGNTTIFNFNTEACRTHRVEYTGSLSDTPWQLLTTVPGTGAVTAVTDSTATGAVRFYRVTTQ